MADDDWTVADTDTAAAVLLYLGIGSEASKEPFIDRRRDAIAKIIRSRVDHEIAQEREGCAFAAECHSGFGDPASIDACAALIRARSEEPDDCIHVPKDVYAQLVSDAAATSPECHLDHRSAPSGWKLVPVVPTHEIIDAGALLQGGYDPLNLRDVYSAMIEAAPTPPCPAASLPHIETSWKSGCDAATSTAPIPLREHLARALAPDAWRRRDTLVGFFARNEGANESQETYGRMYRAGIRTAADAGEWLLADDDGWRLQDSLRDADRAIGALSTFSGEMP